MNERRRLLFVSTRFLFPVDSGGKIRTTQILRGLKGGGFHIRLVCPATKAELDKFGAEIDSVCDELSTWPSPRRSRFFHYTRLRYLPGKLPIPIRTDYDENALRLIETELAEQPDIAVFDFLHAAVLMPKLIKCATLLFTHNVEAEIFRRHLGVARDPLSKALWANQLRKMERFEAESLRRFDGVVAVSDRDGEIFHTNYGYGESLVIPTGVDLDFFSYAPPVRSTDVVFCGSMDWLANQEAMQFFLHDVWPLIVAVEPTAKMTVVGRSPPAGMIDEARRSGANWVFTDFVDDVRPLMQGAAVSVIPLRVGGGTRLKAYESMAMGCPVVSTSIGMEGLPVTAGSHYLCADEPQQFADAVTSLIADADARMALSRDARGFVEQHCSYQNAADVFSKACDTAINSSKQRIAGLAAQPRNTSTAGSQRAQP